MRTFKLTSLVSSTTFDLQSNGIFVVSPKGLGNAYSLSYVTSEKNKHLNNAAPSFESIELTLTFAVSGNKYANYTRLATFLNNTIGTPMILEYGGGNKARQAKVIFKSLSKSQITIENDLEETLVLDRISYWYTTQIERIGHYNGFRSNVSIENNFNAPIPVDITYSVSGVSEASMWVKDASGNIMQRLKWKPKGTDSQYLIIAPSDGKRVTLVKNNVAENGYSLIDKQYKSFIYLPYGTWTIGSDLGQGTSWSIELVITHYIMD